MKNKNSSTIGYLLIALAGILWGTGGLFVLRLAELDISPSTIAFLSQSVGFILIFMYAITKLELKDFLLNRENLMLVLMYGILSKGLTKLSYDTSISIIGMSTASILMYTAPIFTVILSRIVFSDTITTQKIVAIILNITGAVLVITQGNIYTLNLDSLGLILGCIAGFLYATSMIFGKIASSRVDPLVLVVYALLLSSLTTLPFIKFSEISSNITNWNFIKYAIGYGLSCGALANIFFLDGLSYNVDPSTAPIVASIEIVVATLLGSLVLKENFNYIATIGVVVIFLSIFVMNINVRRFNVRRLKRT